MVHPGKPLVNTVGMILLSAGAVFLAVKLASMSLDLKQASPEAESSDGFSKVPTFEKRYLPSYMKV